MTDFPTNIQIYYSFTSSFYNDVDCKEFNNSLIENNSCNYNYDTIDRCCNHIAKLKNVILNICNDSVIYTCDYNKAKGIEKINSFLTNLEIIGIVFLVILGIVFLYNVIIYLIKKINCNRKSYSLIT